LFVLGIRGVEIETGASGVVVARESEDLLAVEELRHGADVEAIGWPV